VLFDFDRFRVSAALAYRRCGGSSYSLQDILEVFRYYFETYELVFEEAHPAISISQIAAMIGEMPHLQDNTQSIEVSPEDYKLMIDQHFVTKYRACDYNINHFFSGKIRNLRYYETCY